MTSRAIPKNRPVLNGDIIPVARHRKMSTLDVQWTLGMSSSEGLSITSSNEPIKEIQRALALRMIADRTDAKLLPETPTVDEVLALCEGCDPSFTKRDFGVLMGRQGASTYRWLANTDSSERALPFAGERWMMIIHRLLSQAPTLAARKKELDQIRQLVFDEAEARGFDLDTLKTQYQWVKREDVAATEQVAR